MPGQMTTAAARVVDAVLTNHARGYKNDDYVLERIFPEVPVVARGGQIIKFDKTAFRRYNTRRAPGSDTKRIQVGYSAGTYSLNQDALDSVLPRELAEESGLIDIDTQSLSISTVMDSLMLGTEYERGQIATTAANYAAGHKLALSGTDKWDDEASNPKEQVDEMREKIRSRVGRYPNVLTLGPKVYRSVKKHPKVLEQFKYTSSMSITLKMLEEYFEVEEIIVPKAVSLPEGATEDSDFEDIWGNFAQLCFVPKSIVGLHVPSFGYTYRLRNYPMVEEAYYEKRNKSFINGVTLEERPYMTANEGGFLLSNVITEA